MHMFLFATEDLCFRLYDRDLTLVEAIKHQVPYLAPI